MINKELKTSRKKLKVIHKGTYSGKDSLDLPSVYCAVHCVALVHVVIVFIVNLVIH